MTIKVDSQSEGRLAVFDCRGKPRSVALELTVRTNEEGPEEALPCSFTIDKASAEPIEGLAPEARKSQESAMEKMQGLDGRYALDSRGAVQDVELLDLPSDPSGLIAGVAEDLKWVLRQLAAPFPKEPIGMGATWTVSRGVKQDGVSDNQVSTFEIIKLRQLVSLKEDVQQGANPQTLKIAGVPTEYELTEFTGEAIGEVTWDLTPLTPRTAKMTSTVTRHTQYQFEGKPMTSVITTRRTLSIPAGREGAPRR